MITRATIATTRTARAGALFGLVAATALLAGCPPCGAGLELASWDFESCAGGPTCGWQALQGSASRVESLTAGEHGLRLEGGTQVEQQLEITLPGTQSTEIVSMVARCEAGSSLQIDQFVNEVSRPSDAGASSADGGSVFGGTTAPQIRRATGTASPNTTWTSVQIRLQPVSGTSLPPLGGADAGAGTSTTTRVAFGLRISTTGSGACVIDEVAYSSLGAGRFCE